MKNIPEKIYLQVGFEPDETDDYRELHGVTWSDRRINDSDLEYQRPEQEAEAPLVIWLCLLAFIVYAVWAGWSLYTM